ncbi:MAG: two-component regulator propeller domain-containing protein [Bacteroidota bacterium]
MINYISKQCTGGVLLLSFSFFNHLSVAQDAVFEHYLDEKGFSYNSIRDITQDEKGFLWLATFSGVYRFEGKTFKKYQFDPNKKSIPSNDVTSITYDAIRKCIWAGTDKGVIQFDLLTDSDEVISGVTSNTNEEISNLQVRSLLLDSENNLWIGTKKKGLFVYTKSGELYKIATPGISYIKTIFIDRHNHLWLGSTSAGIVRAKVNKNFELEEYKIYRENIPQYPDAEAPLVYFFMELEKGTLYAGSIQGLYSFNEKTEKFNLSKAFDSSQGDLRNFLTSYLKRSNGEHWIGTHEGILKIKNLESLEEREFEQFAHKDYDDKSLSNNLIHNLFEDRSGVIWVGSENGLSKYDPFKNQFKPLNNKIFSDLKANAATCFAESFDHQLLIGNIYEGIIIRNGNKFSRILQQYRICSITTLDSINFWIGTWNSELIKFNIADKSVKIFKPDLLNAPPIYALNQLTEKLLLVGTYGNGLKFFNIQTGEIFTPSFLIDYIFPENINKIHQDSDGYIWLCTEGGLIQIHLDLKSIVNYSTNSVKSSLPSNSIKDIVETQDGVIWIATKGGLCFLDKARNSNSIITIKEMQSQWITDIIIDKKGSLWLNINNNSLINYTSKTNDYLEFTVNNGIRTILNSKRGFFFWADSLLYIGGEEGIIYLDPHKIKAYSSNEPPILSELKVRNQLVASGKLLNDQLILREQIAYTDEIQLNDDNNSFSLSFFSPDYINYSSRLFRYKLTPLQNEWIEIPPDEPSVIQYTYLPAGNHTLFIESRDMNSDWSEANLLRVNVKPPIWQTYYAYAFYVLLVVLALYYWQKNVITNLNLKNALLLEKIKIEKEEILHNEKLKFYTNISHELKTPLALILGPIKHLLSINQNREMDEMHQLILRNADRLLKLVNELLDFRKAEAGHLKLKALKVEIVAYTKKITESFTHIAKERNITYTFSTDEKQIKGWLDIDKYDKILYNLLSNAFKYTENHGNITVTLQLLHNKIKITVKDNGIGISKKKQEKIFNRFYQVPNQKITHTGTGIGLSLVKSLIEVQKGIISLKSTSGKGSEFIVELPITKKTYSEEELFTLKERQNVRPQFITDNSSIGDISFPKYKVLIIEDNKELRHFIKTLLTSDYQIYEAQNGKEGLEKTLKIMPKLIIADIMMPKMDGFEFCEKLKKHEEISHIPVILLTALGTHEHTLSGYQLGADDYITKPFEPELLKARIYNLIDNRKILQKKYQNEMHTELDILSNSIPDKNFLDKLKEVVETHIDDPTLSISTICAELYTSQSKLYRKLAELTDLKPNDFIKTIRLKKAVLLLRKTELNVAEVAYKVGFNDPLYFSKCFKKQFAVTPSEIRKTVK